MMDFSKFPHPDKQAYHPMRQWPSDVELPVSIEPDDYKVKIHEIGDDLEPDPENVQVLDYPSCKIVMPNGAALTVVQYGESAFDAEEISTGDWTTYLRGDQLRFHQIVAVAVETIYQALSADIDEANFDEAEADH